MKKKVAILFHCLDMTGGVIAGMHFLQVLDREQVYVTVISNSDGCMREKVASLCDEIQIETQMDSDTFVNRLEESYNLVIVNTITLIPVIDKLNGKAVRVCWWLHECPSYFIVNEEKYLKEFWKNLSSNIELWSAGRFVQNIIRQRYGIDSKVLEFGVEDLADTKVKNVNWVANPNKVTFLCAASAYIPIKGQDLLLLAIVQLPKQYLEKCEFFFAADEQAGKIQIFQMLVLAAKECGNVQPFGFLERESLMELMKQSDCVIVPSREDATNTCAVEAMSMSKICISSDMAGISQYMNSGVNGYVFPSENVDMLIQAIMRVIDEFDDRKEMEDAARQIYEEKFSLETHKKNVDQIFRNMGIYG